MQWSFVAPSSDYYSQQEETLEYFTDYFSVTRKAFLPIILFEEITYIYGNKSTELKLTYS